MVKRAREIGLGQPARRNHAKNQRLDLEPLRVARHHLAQRGHRRGTGMFGARQVQRVARLRRTACVKRKQCCTVKVRGLQRQQPAVVRPQALKVLAGLAWLAQRQAGQCAV